MWMMIKFGSCVYLGFALLGLILYLWSFLTFSVKAVVYSHGSCKPAKVKEFKCCLEKSLNWLLAWKNGILPGKVIVKYQFEEVGYFSCMFIMCFLTVIFKLVAIRILANILPAFQMCFNHKLVIVKHMYKVTPKKVGKSGCILLLFSTIIPAVTA